jgi:type IV pilus assembly protein PilP
MYKHPFIVSIAICSFLIVSVFGCENKTQQIEKAKIVSKKISENSDKLTDIASSNPKISNSTNTNVNLSQDKSPVPNDKFIANLALDSNVETSLVSQDSELSNSRDTGKMSPNETDHDTLAEIKTEQNNITKSGGNSQDILSKSDDEKDIRKAAELLASIHYEVNRSTIDENDGISSLINPFLPLFRNTPDVQNDKIKTKRKTRPEEERTPLEKVDLSQLRLVATLRAESGNKALIEDSTGKGYVIDKGTYIGINSGSVVEITSQTVIVEEEIETLTGDVKIQRREIKLLKAPGE